MKYYYNYFNDSFSIPCGYYFGTSDKLIEDDFISVNASVIIDSPDYHSHIEGIKNFALCGNDEFTISSTENNSNSPYYENIHIEMTEDKFREIFNKCINECINSSIDESNVLKYVKFNLHDKPYVAKLIHKVFNEIIERNKYYGLIICVDHVELVSEYDDSNYYYPDYFTPIDLTELKVTEISKEEFLNEFNKNIDKLRNLI